MTDGSRWAPRRVGPGGLATVSNGDARLRLNATRLEDKTQRLEVSAGSPRGWIEREGLKKLKLRKERNGDYIYSIATGARRGEREMRFASSVSVRKRSSKGQENLRVQARLRRRSELAVIFRMYDPVLQPWYLDAVSYLDAVISRRVGPGVLLGAPASADRPRFHPDKVSSPAKRSAPRRSDTDTQDRIGKDRKPRSMDVQQIRLYICAPQRRICTQQRREDERRETTLYTALTEFIRESAEWMVNQPSAEGIDAWMDHGSWVDEMRWSEAGRARASRIPGMNDLAMRVDGPRM
ncbi:hypothetical protein C8R45DRAFT_925159 [Mycena sanguinolenta]|nr:hypothetical protein C8R45DRAFT_925159 [Mycena sanguinolenta]